MGVPLIIAFTIRSNWAELSFGAVGPDEGGQWCGVVYDATMRPLLTTGPDYPTQELAGTNARRIAGEIKAEVERAEQPQPRSES